MKIKKIDIFFTISIILYLFSLTQNAFYVNNEEEYSGYLILILGLYAFLGGGAGISWLANIMILFSWATYKKKISIYFIFSAIK